MTNDLVKSGGTEVTTKTGGLTTFGQTPYITHEQAAALYGDTKFLGSEEPNSVLGVLYKIKCELQGIVSSRRRSEGDKNPQLGQDDNDLARLHEILEALTYHAKNGGYHLEKKGSGLKRLFSTELIPIGTIAAPLPENSTRFINGKGHKRHPYFLEIRNFTEQIKNLSAMITRYRGDLGETTYNRLLQDLQTASSASGFFHETTALPEGTGSTGDGTSDDHIRKIVDRGSAQNSNISVR